MDSVFREVGPEAEAGWRSVMEILAARGEAVPTADRPARGNLWAGVTPNRGAR
jgi:hypothetical protein